MNEEIYLSFDRYLAHEMPADERVAFELQLRSDTALAEKLRIYQEVQEIVGPRYQREEQEIAFRKNLALIGHEELVEKTGRTVKVNWYVWAVAASIALICAFFFYTSYSTPEYSDYAHYEPLALVERGNEDASILKAQQAFNTQQYAEAVEAINALLKQYDKNDALKIYKGISLLELDRVAEANSLFTEVSNSSSIYKDKALWMLALSALKQKDYKTSEDFLKKIPAGSSEYKQAQDLLDKL
jgi:cytochrome c-type biogenesis protein CcmH/NrfG